MLRRLGASRLDGGGYFWLFFFFCFFFSPLAGLDSLEGSVTNDCLAAKEGGSESSTLPCAIVYYHR